MTNPVDVTGGRWGGDCDLSQVHKQAKESALARIASHQGLHDITIIGQEKVTAILIEDE